MTVHYAILFIKVLDVTLSCIYADLTYGLLVLGLLPISTALA
ncbi:MAG: hypothetical protein AAF915_19575 [Cyanobacteria bacterium P01_D01_bin.50]